MNTPNPQDCSTIQVEILLEESWIDKFLEKKNLTIPLNDQKSLTNLRINIGEGTLNIRADLEEKENTSIEVTSRPEWDNENQRIIINDLKLKADSKNIFLKSAGWFAQNFLNAKLDRKLEEQANKMFTRQLEKLKEKPVDIPLPDGSNINITVSSITIQELTFIDHSIRVKATIDAYPKLHLFLRES